MEHLPIREYNLKIFTIINSTALQNGMGGFKFKTPEEETEAFLGQIEEVKRRGLSL